MNISDRPVSLAGWHFEAIRYTFAEDVTIAAGGLVTVVPLTPDDFRATHNVPDEARLFGPYLGSLSNAGESLRLNKPGQPEPDGFIPSIMVDRVSYDDKLPWPVEADGTGATLQRKQADGYGNEPTNWGVTVPGGTPGDFVVQPTVIEVLVSGSDWSPAMPKFSIPAGADQLQMLPWTGLDRISIRFSEHVELSSADLRVAGETALGYDVTDFRYDRATWTATWTLDRPLLADKLLVELSSSLGSGVRDASGLPLDGNWSDATSTFPSGNGAIDRDGDAFRFRLNVVPGDVTGDGRVDRRDLIDLIHHLGDTAATEPSLRRDLTGDGLLDVFDLRAALSLLGSRLPSGEPQQSGSAKPQAAVDAVFERIGNEAPAANARRNPPAALLEGDDSLASPIRRLADGTAARRHRASADEVPDDAIPRRHRRR